MDIKEKPKSKGDSPKSRAAPAIDPKQAAKLLKDKYVKELEQRPESESVDAQAAEQVQDTGTWAVDEIVSRPIPKQKKQTVKEKPVTPHRAADRSTADPPAVPAGEGREAVPPGERGRTTAEPRLSVPDGAEPVSSSTPVPTAKRQAVSTTPRDRNQNGRPIIKERGEAVISTRQAATGNGAKNNIHTPTEREISPRAGTKAEQITQRTASIKEKAPTMPHERTVVHTPTADGGNPTIPRPKGGDHASVVDLKPPVNRSTAVSEWQGAATIRRWNPHRVDPGLAHWLRTGASCSGQSAPWGHKDGDQRQACYFCCGGIFRSADGLSQLPQARPVCRKGVAHRGHALCGRSSGAKKRTHCQASHRLSLGSTESWPWKEKGHHCHVEPGIKSGDSKHCFRVFSDI